VLDHGRVIDRGAPADLKRRLGDDRVVVTLARPGEAERAAAVLCPLSAATPSVDAAEGTVTATVRPGRGALAAVVRELDDARIELADVTVKQPTLEDVYVALTGAPPAASSPGLAGARS
jgi:ABC-2 type transport system ATP-binding protein